jgi:type I site-specific restriction endonuclease
MVNLVISNRSAPNQILADDGGRSTRLCPDLFDQDKEFFRVFDYCQNLEFFGSNPEVKEASAAKSLSERLFAPDQGIMDSALLYAPPFTDIAPPGLTIYSEMSG